MKLTAGRNPPVLWCRSEKFAAPQTGMLAVSVRMKAVIPPGGAQPNLAVALDTMDDVHYDPIFIGLNGVNKLTNEWRDLVFRFPIPANLPPAALGFDLRGPGEVWIDDIKLYDVWLEPGEKSALMFNSGRAIEGTRDGEIGLSLDFLDSYWTRFLRQHAQPVKRVAEGQPVEKAGNRWFPAIPIPRLRR
jgi:hypothetical protein